MKKLILSILCVVCVIGRLSASAARSKDLSTINDRLAKCKFNASVNLPDSAQADKNALDQIGEYGKELQRSLECLCKDVPSDLVEYIVDLLQENRQLKEENGRLKEEPKKIIKAIADQLMANRAALQALVEAGRQTGR